MYSNKSKVFYGFSIGVGILLVLLGLLLWIPRSTRSDTPDAYYYNIYCLRILLPTVGILLMFIGSSVNASYNSLKKEIDILQEKYRALERKL